MLHETFDVFQSTMRLVTQPLGDVGLPVKAQAVIAAFRQEMQMAAHCPEEALAFLEHRKLIARECALLGEFVGGVGCVEKLGDPEQGIEIAQSAFAILDVGLDQIAALADLHVARVALIELVGNEATRILFDDLTAEVGHQPLKQPHVATDEAGLEDGSENRIVGFRQPDAFIDVAGRMADLLARIPERVENELDDVLNPLRLPRRQHEQQVDIRTRRQRATAITADGNHGDPLLGLCRRGKNFIAGKVEEPANEFVLGKAQCLGADGALAIGDEFFLGPGVGVFEPPLQVLDDRLPHRHGVARMSGGDGRQPRLQLGRIDELWWLKWMFHSVLARSALSS